MYIKFVCWLMFFIFVINLFPVSSSLQESSGDIVIVNLLNDARLEEINGIKVLYICGSNYEMGFQAGYFLKNDYIESRRAWINFVEEKGYCYNDLVDIFYEVEDLIPLEYKSEMQGKADALGFSFQDVAVMDMLGPLLYSTSACCSATFWNSATVDGELYHARSADYPLDLVDPITGTFAHDKQLIIIRDPENGYASICPTNVIEVGVEGGVNEEGISVSYTTVVTDDTSIYGIPLGIRQRMMLDHASNASEAIEIMNSNRTASYNIFISDGNIPEGFVVEQSANYSYVSSWNDSIESHRQSYEIDHVVRRSNYYIAPELSSIQKQYYSNRNSLIWRLLYKMNLLDGYRCFTGPYRHYIALSKGIKRYHGRLDLNTSFEMLRKVYLGKTDLIFRFNQNFYNVYKEVWAQSVICPKTGDIIVSFARGDKNAYETPFVRLNLFDFIKT